MHAQARKRNLLDGEAGADFVSRSAEFRHVRALSVLAAHHKAAFHEEGLRLAHGADGAGDRALIGRIDRLGDVVDRGHRLIGREKPVDFLRLLLAVLVDEGVFDHLLVKENLALEPPDRRLPLGARGADEGPHFLVGDLAALHDFRIDGLLSGVVGVEIGDRERERVHDLAHVRHVRGRGGGRRGQTRQSLLDSLARRFGGGLGDRFPEFRRLGDVERRSARVFLGHSLFPWFATTRHGQTE